jgi:hypothetical protein
MKRYRSSSPSPHAKIVAHNGVTLHKVRPRVLRVHDLDDQCFELMRTRERPSTMTMPMPVQTGLATLRGRKEASDLAATDD